MGVARAGGGAEEEAGALTDAVVARAGAVTDKAVVRAGDVSSDVVARAGDVSGDVVAWGVVDADVGARAKVGSSGVAVEDVDAEFDAGDLVDGGDG